jgi:hypothetical protein
MRPFSDRGAADHAGRGDDLLFAGPTRKTVNYRFGALAFLELPQFFGRKCNGLQWDVLAVQ